MRTFPDFTGYEVIDGVDFTIELRLVIAMREKGHDYTFMSSLVRNIVNGLEDFFRTLSTVWDSILFVPAAKTVTSVTGICLIRALIPRAVRPGKTQPYASKPFPWTSGATPRTIELPMTVTVMFSCWLGPACDVTALEDLGLRLSGV